MSDGKKSFSDLLKEAPLAPSTDTITLVGALARSSSPDKFVLATGQGSSLTLDVAAVKSHQVLGGGVGQLLVQVEVDRNQVPEEAKAAQSPVANTITGVNDIKHPVFETGWVDVKHPNLDKHPWMDPVTNPHLDLRPFALATATQAPEQAIAAMQAVPAGNRTAPTWDYHTGVWDHNTGLQDNKPIQDGATGHPPAWD